jgi:hypothetical protein
MRCLRPRVEVARHFAKFSIPRHRNTLGGGAEFRFALNQLRTDRAGLALRGAVIAGLASIAGVLIGIVAIAISVWLAK